MNEGRKKPSFTFSGKHTDVSRRRGKHLRSCEIHHIETKTCTGAASSKCRGVKKGKEKSDKFPKQQSV